MTRHQKLNLKAFELNHHQLLGTVIKKEEMSISH